MPSFGWYVLITAAVLLCIYLLVQLGVFSGNDDAALALGLLPASSDGPIGTVRAGLLEAGRS